jgi:hypothetical protein
MTTSVPKGARAEQADGVGEQSSRRGCALERGCGVIQYLEAESCGSSRSRRMDSDFRVDEAKPCSAGARSGDRGGPDPTCRAVTAVDAESAAAPFAPNASDRSATFPASRWR